jgi:hypothetical protein
MAITMAVDSSTSTMAVLLTQGQGKNRAAVETARTVVSLTPTFGAT